MEFASLVVNFHSTDGVSCHDSSTIEFCSSVFHFAAGITAKTLPFFAVSKSLICFSLPAQKSLMQKDLRKIFHSGARYTQPNSRKCSKAISKTRIVSTDHESPAAAFCISCAPLWTICRATFPTLRDRTLPLAQFAPSMRPRHTSMKDFPTRIDPQFRASHFPQLHQKY